MQTILITGGTGLIGRALTKALTDKGYKVIILTRDPSKHKAEGNVSFAAWDLNRQTIDEKAIGAANFIVHLAGANVAEGRWTEARKKEIRDSRVHSGALLVHALAHMPNKVEAVISASAIGYYGPDPVIPNPKPFVESAMPYRDFLAGVVVDWENVLHPAATEERRLVFLRTGIVLSKEGGAFAEFVKPLNFGVASVLGSGKQIVSWIHKDDLVRLYIEAIENKRYQGVYNAVAPLPVSNRQLIGEIAHQRQKFYITAPVPAFVLKTMLGEMSIEVLKSTTVSAAKLEREGFVFFYPAIQSAVRQLVS